MKTAFELSKELIQNVKPSMAYAGGDFAALCKSANADVFLTGEYGDAQVKINGGEVAETYFTTFHHTAAAHQAADIALLWRYVTGTAKKCSLRADGCAARAAACVLPLLEGLDTAYLERAMLELSGVEDYYRECFITSILSLGGMDGCIAMASCRVELF